MDISTNETDFYTSVLKSLNEIDQNFRNYKGLIVVGSHTPLNVEDKMVELKNARENNIPTLGICMGMQLMAIEYARNVMDVPTATSEEISNDGVLVVRRLPKLRVGIYPVTWEGETKQESHWHNYAIRTDYLKDNFDISHTEDIPEVIKLKDHLFYVGVQFHPEYQSSREKPHPLLKEFVKVCSQKTN